MLRISKLTDYSTIILAAMAAEPENLHTAQDLSKQTQIAGPTVGKVLKALTKAQLLHSQRGAQGGYRLNRSPKNIALSEILSALEGPFAITECNSQHHQCHHERVCQMSRHWQTINQVIHSTLTKISLADLITPQIPVRFAQAKSINV